MGFLDLIEKILVSNSFPKGVARLCFTDQPLFHEQHTLTRTLICGISNT